MAREAGVSQAAVSLVLGDKWRGRVSEATAERVRTAVRELGYRPNLAARNLRLGRTRTVLLVVPALTNEFFARLHSGAAAVAAEHGTGVVLYPSGGIGPARDPFDSARASLDGVIASSMAAEALAAIRGDELPLVMLDSDPGDAAESAEPAASTGGSASDRAGGPDQTGPTATHEAGTARGAATVNLDLADGVRQLTEHLLGLGHRDFLHLAADVDSWTFAVRAEALATYLRPAGARLRTVRTALSVRDAHVAAQSALASGPRPTALVCDDDIMAAGACKAARRLGLRVPEDLSVTGFDDLTLATAVEPELTTVRLPAEDFGAAGMRTLLAVLDGRSPAPAPLPVRLIVRGSTGPAAVRAD
ncbi:LacI family DNA-binding transcriptional regulator [Streptomyces sp. NA04227]|uniref:LacI family DNA-binding transcriptional regulator n=1 Tax=Streptomyces sp. NA04227 TaxID=2742136 RepID=UPI0020CA6714|nr:LacI family DNA-binding transcriptional regulator [Streptomyces sp. NA04227]